MDRGRVTRPRVEYRVEYFILTSKGCEEQLFEGPNTQQLVKSVTVTVTGLLYL